MRTGITITRMNEAVSGPVLLRLLQLASPALPVGAFAYSQGLEGAVAAGWVRDELSASRWILGLLAGSLAALDLPVLARVHAAWGAADRAAAWGWSELLYASRPTAELQAEERHLARALARVLGGQGVRDVEALVAEARGGAGLTYAAVFAVACRAWEIPAPAALGGFAFAWTEAQVGAALRLVPLGQSAGQRILNAAVAAIPAAVAAALVLPDDDVGAAAPAHAVASARHETQYSRLFRS
jgi:urease accessory protein